MKKKIITSGILILSFVSFFTDISSEVLYPVIPVYLKSIGFTALWIGLLEGFAEASAGLSKGIFGAWSDRVSRRLPFVKAGYLLSAVAKPLLAVSILPIWVFLVRFADRLGKGIRSGAKDALLSGMTEPQHRGTVFGFHRAADTLGATVGPILAIIYLHSYPEHYTNLFLFAFFPALCAFVLLFILKEKRKEKTLTTSSINPFRFFNYWKRAEIQYKKIVIGFLVFTLVNSSDMLLLLLAKSKGISDENVIGAYIFYNLIYALASWPIGILSDKIGMRVTYIVGLFLFAIVYSGMAFVEDLSSIYILFFIYGLFAACNEGISKAWITKVCKKEETGTAIGFFSGFSSILTLAASSLTGLIWVTVSPVVAFMVSGVVAVIVMFYFLIIVKERTSS